MSQSAQSTPPDLEAPLRKIQEVAAELGLTARAIRYYEEVGLLAPAARSGGAYRLYDPDDVERLRFIKGLRDDAGFSLTEIGQLLEDEAMRARNRDRFRTTDDATERRAIIDDTLVRVERQIDTLRDKMTRLAGMIEEAEGRRDHLRVHLAELDAGREPEPHVHTRSGSRPLAGSSGRTAP
ncbi:MAG: MerR family transcriptional regulator [Chloroflexi bacterium]|nr:MerR family transcriptional regulator [Chloroflexota bacterium]